MPDLHVVILAAGKGTRMKSALPKVLHRVAGVPMIEYVLDTALGLSPKTMALVVGHGAQALQTGLSKRSGLRYVNQEQQLGTAHALLATESLFQDISGDILLLSGDVPLLSPRSLHALVDHHRERRAAATVVTANVENPHGYGRIVRLAGQIVRIVEEKDADPEERGIREINSGIYCLSLDGLFNAVRSIATANAQHEYYLPDLVAIYRSKGRIVETVEVDDPDEIRGINSRVELADVSRIVRARKNAEVMAAGVTLEDPATIYVGRDVQIGNDTVIHPGVSLEGRTTIGSGCEIHSGVRIVDSAIGDGVTIQNHCVISQAFVASEATVGPFAHLRNEATIGLHAKVGNFVEVKRSSLGAGTKAMHLAYLGDADIGANVNIGAGTITCNYDGVTKQKTTIEDSAFIGSDSQLIAPVTIGKGAYVGTGTTVRENVPAGALAVSAGKQRHVDGWVAKRKKSKS